MTAIIYGLFYVLLTVLLDILCNDNQIDALFTSIYFINQPLHVSGMFIAQQQEVFTVYVLQLAAGRVRMELHPELASCQSPNTCNTYQLLYIYSEYLLMMGNKHARNM
jgi:hypothetical protein